MLRYYIGYVQTSHLSTLFSIDNDADNFAECRKDGVQRLFHRSFLDFRVEIVYIQLHAQIA